MGKVVTRKAGAGRTRSVKKQRHSSLYVKIRNKYDSIEGAHGGHAGEFGQLGTNRLQRRFTKQNVIDSLVINTTKIHKQLTMSDEKYG